jgi:hypothetical protein
MSGREPLIRQAECSHIEMVNHRNKQCRWFHLSGDVICLCFGRGASFVCFGFFPSANIQNQA